MTRDGEVKQRQHFYHHGDTICHPRSGYAGLEIRGILVANATMFSHLLPGFSSGSKHLLLP